MDAAISLVEAYLHANGYLTATEYPIVEAVEGGGYRMVTDIDVLAIRLPGAGRVVSTEHGKAAYQSRVWEPDPRLISPGADDRIDFILAEVKQGKAELNRGARKPETIITGIRRFAFVAPSVAERLARQLLKSGEASIPEEKVRIRLFAFGSRKTDSPGTPNVILLDECLEYLIGIWRECEELTATVQVRHLVPSLLAILSKAGYLADESTHKKAKPK